MSPWARASQRVGCSSRPCTRHTCTGGLGQEEEGTDFGHPVDPHADEGVPQAGAGQVQHAAQVAVQGELGHLDREGRQMCKLSMNIE